MGQINYNEVAIQSNVGFTVAETKEDYSIKPTFTQYPNAVFDTLSSEGLPLTAYLSPAEEKVLNRCVRMANGYHRAKFRMSLSEMAELTGLSKTGVVNCVNSLGETKLISYSASNGVGSWSLALDKLESALEYFVSKYRTTQLYSNKKKVRTTELANRTTELYDNDQTVQLSGTPSIKEKDSKEIKEITTTPPFLKSEELANQSSEIEPQKRGKDSSERPTPIKAVVKKAPPVANTPPAIDPRIIAFCDVMGWQLSGGGVLAKAGPIVSELCAFFGDSLTGDDMSAALKHIKAIESKMDTRTIKAKFGEAVQDVERMANPENKQIVEAIKVMYGHTKGVDYRLEFEYSKLASRMAQQGIKPEQVLAFPAIWRSHYDAGISLPGYDNFKLITNIKNMEMKTAPSAKPNPQSVSQNFQINQSKLDRLTV